MANVSNGVITTAYDTSYSKAGTAEIAVNVTIKDSAVNYYADSELSHSINVTLTKYVKGTNITITSDSDDFAWDASAGEYKVTLYKARRSGSMPNLTMDQQMLLIIRSQKAAKR